MLSHFSSVHLCDALDCRPSGISDHGILQARILERFDMPSSRGPSWPRNQTCVSYIFKYSVSESEVAQSCPTLWDPMDCSLSGSVHGIFQARVLEWIAISFSRGSSQPRTWTWVSRTAGRRFTVWATREAPSTQYLTIIIYGMLASFQWALQNIFCFMVNMRVSLTRMSTVQCLYVLFLLR